MSGEPTYRCKYSLNTEKEDFTLSKILSFLDLKLLRFVIPLGFEPKTHSLEGCCSNPTELRNLQIDCKGNVFFSNTMLFCNILLGFI